MKAKIRDKREAARGVLEVSFELSEPAAFQPGQSARIMLLNPPYDDAAGRRRFFCITNPPSENRFIKITTRIRDTAFKKSLLEMPVGTEVEISDIGGTFLLPAKTDKQLVFIAGGIGITPFMSMLRHIKEKSLLYRITLLYSNRDQASAAFLPELRETQKQLQNFKLVLTMTDDALWNGEKRRIDKEFLKDCVPDPARALFYIAGPPVMVAAMYDAVSALGVGASNILSEDFSGY